MKVRKFLVILVPIGLASLAIVVIVAGNLSNSVSAQSQNGPVSHLTQKIHPVTGPDRGFTSIKPHLHPANRNEPTYTTTDVKNFVLSHDAPSGPLVPGAHMSIKEVVFLTAGQAALLPLGDETGYPSNAAVCYVLIHGPFYPLNMHTPFGTSGPPKPVQYNVIIFDGVTGNYLYWGIPSNDINWSSYFKDRAPD